MAGTKEGARKATLTNKRLHGEDFYHRIGKKGGSAKVPKGFSMGDNARVAGALGLAARRTNRERVGNECR